MRGKRLKFNYLPISLLWVAVLYADVLPAQSKHDVKDSIQILFKKIGEGYGNFESKYAYATAALSLSKKIKDSHSIVLSYQKIGDVLWYKGIFGRSEDAYRKSLYLANYSKYPREHAYALYSIGWIESLQKGRMEKSIYLRKAFSIYKNLKDTVGVLMAVNALSGVYSEWGTSHNDNKYIDTGIYYLNYALKMCKSNARLSGREAHFEANLAEEYANKGEYTLATKFIDSAMFHLTIKSNLNVYLHAIVVKSKILSKTNRNREAIQLLVDNMDNIQQNGDAEKTKVVTNYLYSFYKNIGDMKKALEYHEKYCEIVSKSYEQLLSDKFEEAETNERLSQKEKHISELKKQNKLFAIQEKERLYMFALEDTTLFLVLLFLVYIIRKNRKTKKLNVEISAQKALVEEKNKEIHDSITYAKRIQEAILPSRFTLTENLNNGFVLFQPKDIVSGDFYWLEKVGKATYFAAADCTGHGVPGAMVSVVCANALSKALLEENITDTGKLLDRTRELVIERFENSDEDVKDGMDISLCKLEGNQLQWSGANNPLWLIRKGASELEEIKADKQPIGKTLESKLFTAHEIDLQEGDTLYIFTDGYADQFGGKNGKKFMYKPMKELLISLQDKSMDEQKEKLRQSFANWKGGLEQVDDVCIIGVRI